LKIIITKLIINYVLLNAAAVDGLNKNTKVTSYLSKCQYCTRRRCGWLREEYNVCISHWPLHPRSSIDGSLKNFCLMFITTVVQRNSVTKSPSTDLLFLQYSLTFTLQSVEKGFSKYIWFLSFQLVRRFRYFTSQTSDILLNTIHQQISAFEINTLLKFPIWSNSFRKFVPRFDTCSRKRVISQTEYNNYSQSARLIFELK